VSGSNHSLRRGVLSVLAGALLVLVGAVPAVAVSVHPSVSGALDFSRRGHHHVCKHSKHPKRCACRHSKHRRRCRRPKPKPTPSPACTEFCYPPPQQSGAKVLEPQSTDTHGKRTSFIARPAVSVGLVLGILVFGVLLYVFRSRLRQVLTQQRPRGP
jgi:hypothetical protein